ncbi:hypothetical protein N7533_004980 [Penicillium manginii]|jgi:hypothetical protein|uniref:uncharacterized protein n=1 Tax=Penicillium manginii TaxID=203109 RepID=UPI002546811E|nr:uncharacterized protein N7533_004980 [Penicillium manginii]KAJ5755437.1 hypothetical protein N7533_004980 [Penicillium manginii]
MVRENAQGYDKSPFKLHRRLPSLSGALGIRQARITSYHSTTNVHAAANWPISTRAYKTSLPNEQKTGVSNEG